MKKLISFLLSVTLCGSMLTIFPAASWDLDEQEAVEGDISSYVQVEEVTFGEPEPLAETLNIDTYNNALISGSTISDAVWSASLQANKIVPLGGSTLASALVEGDGEARIAEPQTRQQINLLEGINQVELNIPYDASVISYSNSEVQKGENLLNKDLITEVEKINPNFSQEYYTVKTNTYGDNLYTVFLSKIIPTATENVVTGVNYTISVRDGVAFLLTYSDQPTAEMISKEASLADRISNFKDNGGEKNIELPELPNAEINIQDSYYGYQYEGDELFYIIDYEVTHLDEDGALSADQIMVPVP